MSSDIDPPNKSHMYDLLYEKSLLCYQSLDKDGNFIIVNPAWCALLGYSQSEVIGKWFGDFMAPESKEKLRECFLKFQQTGLAFGYEFSMLCKDGAVIDVSIDGRIEYDDQGHFIQTHCIVQDQANIYKNTALEEGFKHIFENSLNEIFVFDANTYKFIKVNRGARENIGYTQNELNHLTPLDIKPELSIQQFNALLEPLRSGAEEIIRFDTVHLRKNGTLYYIEVHLQLTTFLLKPAFIAIILDVTQRKEIEYRLDLVIQGANLGYWDWDYVTGGHHVNDRWLEMLGLNRGDLDNYFSDWNNRIHPDDQQRVRDTVKHSIESKKPYTVEFRMQHKQDYWVWIQGAGSVVAYDTDNKSALRLCGTHQNISVRKKNDEQIRQLSQAVDQSPNLIIIMDTDATIEYVNPKIFEITGYSIDEVIGKNISIFAPDGGSVGQKKEYWDTIKSGKEWRGTFKNKKKGGELYWARESIAPIKDENNNISHFVAIQEDITEAKKVSEQLNYQATHDALTELINRREFENRVSRTIETAKQNNSKHVLCYLDLDQFKIINDTCTHVAGDELLKQFANILLGTFRFRDSVGRLGGDEFAVLLEHCSVQQAEQHAQQLLDKVRNFQFHWNNTSFRIGVSIGIVAIDQNTQNMSALLSHADIACYSAKNAGRHRIHVFQDNDNDLTFVHKELQWISRINRALNENLFSLYLQPIFRLDDYLKAPDHFEVLIRLQDSYGEIIPPGAFLPAVERFNLSLQVDEWVISKVFDWIQKIGHKKCQLPFLSINLSGQNLGNKQLLAYIKKQLETHSEVSTEQICFEITETAAINNLTDAKAFISELSELGCKFSLDDFGSGLSSFDYLRNLPVDLLKIDGQFVKDIECDPIDAALVKSINEIGHVMGKKTIAEFVENKQILEILVELEVDFVQGYFLGKPKPIDTY